MHRSDGPGPVAWVFALGLMGALAAACTPSSPSADAFEDASKDTDAVEGECEAPESDEAGRDQEEERFVELINAYRAENKLPPLAVCRSLDLAAQLHSEDMRDQKYFSHTGLDGALPDERGCEACFEVACGEATFGENIAAGYLDAKNTFEQWRNSPGHNANMLKPYYTTMGIGRALGGEYGAHWTNAFAGEDDPSCE